MLFLSMSCKVQRRAKPAFQLCSWIINNPGLCQCRQRMARQPNEPVCLVPKTHFLLWLEMGAKKSLGTLPSSQLKPIYNSCGSMLDPNCTLSTATSPLLTNISHPLIPNPTPLPLPSTPLPPIPISTPLPQHASSPPLANSSSPLPTRKYKSHN